MTPQEAEQIMSPFYPHDLNLAIKAMGTALGGHVPEWILESVVGSYFDFLQLQELQARIKALEMHNRDPFRLGTVPFKLESPEIDLN